MSKVGEYYKELKELGINPIDIKPSKNKWDDFIPEIMEECNKFGVPVSDAIKLQKEKLAIEKDNL